MKKFLVIGNPIEHSLSPKLHNLWIKKSKIDAIYDKEKLTENELKKLISKLREKNLHGINVTIPFKNTIIPYLDQLTKEANKTQSVNTVYLKNGKVIGHNTDINGFEMSIKKLKLNLENKKVLILGAGGVVPSIIFALNRMEIAEIMVANRTKDKTLRLIKLFKNIKVVNWGDVPLVDVIINATSIGLNKDDEFKLDLSKAGSNKFFYDVIYSPQETAFLKIGKKMGNRTENGKFMFLYQALEAFEIWHGIKPEIDDEVIKLFEND